MDATSRRQLSWDAPKLTAMTVCKWPRPPVRSRARKLPFGASARPAIGNFPWLSGSPAVVLNRPGIRRVQTAMNGLDRPIG